MPHLLYSANDNQGQSVQGFIDAASVREAQQRLLDQGLRDVVLHQETSIPTDARELAGLSQRELRELARLRLQAMQRPGLLPVWQEVARASAKWLLFDAAILAAGLWTASTWLIACGAVLLVLPFAIAAWQYRHGGRYTQLIKSFSVGEWDRVIGLAAKLRRLGLQTDQLEFDLDVRLACIEARQGRIAQALAGLESWRPRLQPFPGMYEGRVASVHAAGGDRAGYVDLMARAAELAGDEPARQLDLALAHARFGDIAVAADLLRTIDANLLPPHAQHFVSWVDGLVQLRQGQPSQAVGRLGEAVGGFLALAGNPAVWTSLAFCTCDHAVALSMAGRKDEARRELAQVWPIVKAHADRPLLRMLQADGLAPH